MSEQSLYEFVAKRDAEYAKLGIYGERSPYSANQHAPFYVFEGELVRKRDGKFIRPEYAKPRADNGKHVQQSAYVRFLALNPYPFPGGGEHFAITTDGGVICRACVLKNRREILESEKYRHTGWHIAAIDTTYNREPDAPIYCDGCSRDLQGVE